MPVTKPPDVSLPGGAFSIYQKGIDFALVLKAYMQKGCRYYGALGGQIGVIISTDQEISEIVRTIDGQKEIQNTSIDLSNSMKEMDFSIVLALGVELITASGPNFRWDLQYTHGIVEPTNLNAS